MIVTLAPVVEPSPSGQICPRCGIRPAEGLVVGRAYEPEIIAVCRGCRGSG